MISFLILISVVVFFHELGHYIFARLCGVKIDSFSIGFGKEIVGFTDKNSTRWKVCILPLGGYVKMYGDENPASVDIGDSLSKLSEDEKKFSFLAKSPFEKIIISFAGPLFNFILAFFLFFSVCYFKGITKTSTIVKDIVLDSPASEVGIMPHDDIIEINGNTVEDFSDIRRLVMLSEGRNMLFKVRRNGSVFEFQIKPKANTSEILDQKFNSYFIGIISDDPVFLKLGIIDSTVHSFKELSRLTKITFFGLIDLVRGKVSLKNLGGPIKIAKLSSSVSEKGVFSFLGFIGLISINLGIFNLFPIPGLDGGNIFINLIEIVTRRPVPKKLAIVINYIGFGLIGVLMFFAFYNDIAGILSSR